MDPAEERFRRARKTFEAYAECIHGGFSIYCEYCRDPRHIFESRTRVGKFRDSITALEQAGLLDEIEVVEIRESGHQVHKPFTLLELAKADRFLIGATLVSETLKHRSDLLGIALHFFQKGKDSPQGAAND